MTDSEFAMEMPRNRRSTLNLLGVPDQFGVLLLTFALVLTVAPYLGEVHMGIFKVPKFSTEQTMRLQYLGPFILVIFLLLFLRVWSPVVPLSSSVDDKQQCLLHVFTTLRNGCATAIEDLSDTKLHDAASFHVIFKIDNTAGFEDLIDQWYQLEPESFFFTERVRNQYRSLTKQFLKERLSSPFRQAAISEINEWHVYFDSRSRDSHSNPVVPAAWRT
jgi:hypothetical protein